VLLFAGLVSVCGGALFSAGPALHLYLSEMRNGLKEGDVVPRGETVRKIGPSLVAVELAITAVLLVGAGLLAKSLYRLLHVDIGISPDQFGNIACFKARAGER